MAFVHTRPSTSASMLSAIFFALFLYQCSGIAVTGISAGVNNYTNARPFRVEINAFSQSGPAFDLYIQALQIFQNQSGDLSYFGVSGIHGYPLIPWDGVNPFPGSKANDGVGYCAHYSNLFPVWHRPYLALFEQAIWNIVNTIASAYPYDQVEAYTAVVDTWRIPYWDWADANNPGMPSVVASPSISINTPSGMQTVANPLYTYRFPDYPRNIPKMGGNGFMGDWLSTVRHPTTGTKNGGNGTQDDKATNNAVFDSTATLHQLTYQLLSATSVPFNNFATEANRALSIEQVHDQIHMLVGGPGGHMEYIPWSSFDPVFWLHHANVDRLFAIWQAINPDKYVEPQWNPATYAIPRSEGTIDSPLYPFHSTPDNITFHTPASVRSTKAFGYTYPEVVDWNTTTDSLQTDVIAKVNELYNSDAGSNNTTSPSPSNHTRHRRHSRSTRIGTLAARSKRKTLTPSNLLTYQVNNLPSQYVLNITLLLQPQSTTFYFFLGPAPPASASAAAAAASSSFLSSPPPPPPPPPANLLATHSHFGAPPPNSSASSSSSSSLNANATVNVTTHALVPITAALYAFVLQGAIRSLDWDVVAPLLQREKIGVLATTGTGTGTAAGFEEMGMEVQVLQRDVVPRRHVEEFPGYGEWRGVCEEGCVVGLGWVADAGRSF